MIELDKMKMATRLTNNESVNFLVSFQDICFFPFNAGMLHSNRISGRTALVSVSSSFISCQRPEDQQYSLPRTNPAGALAFFLRLSPPPLDYFISRTDMQSVSGRKRHRPRHRRRRGRRRWSRHDLVNTARDRCLAAVTPSTISRFISDSFLQCQNGPSNQTSS